MPDMLINYRMLLYNSSYAYLLIYYRFIFFLITTLIFKVHFDLTALYKDYNLTTNRTLVFFLNYKQLLATLHFMINEISPSHISILCPLRRREGILLCTCRSVGRPVGRLVGRSVRR